MANYNTPRDADPGRSSDDSDSFDALVANNPKLAKSANLIGSAIRNGLIEIKIEGNLLVASGRCIVGDEIPDRMSLTEWKSFMAEISASLSEVCDALGIKIDNKRMVVRKVRDKNDN